MCPMGKWMNVAFVQMADLGRLEAAVERLLEEAGRHQVRPPPRTPEAYEPMQYGHGEDVPRWGLAGFLASPGWCALRSAPYELLMGGGAPSLARGRGRRDIHAPVPWRGPHPVASPPGPRGARDGGWPGRHVPERGREGGGSAPGVRRRGRGVLRQWLPRRNAHPARPPAPQPRLRSLWRPRSALALTTPVTLRCSSALNVRR